MDDPIDINNQTSLTFITSDAFRILIDYVHEKTSFDIELGTFLLDPNSKETYILWFFELAFLK
jgi:hypothetical protein